MGALSRLPNIGKVVEEQLNQVGIMSEEDLKAAGSKQAWLKIQEIDETACIHRLLLPEDVKADLKEFYQWHKK